MSITKVENESTSNTIDLTTEMSTTKVEAHTKHPNSICTRKNQFFDTPQELFDTFMYNKTSTKQHKPKAIYVHSERYENIEKLLRKTGRTLKVTKKEDSEVMRRLFKVKRGSRSQLRTEHMVMTSRLSDARLIHLYLS